MLDNFDFGSNSGYKIKGIVAHYIETASIEELTNILASAKKNGIKLSPCGDGSNILIKDRYDGMFVKWTKSDIEILKNDKDNILVKVDSGVKKEELTDYCVKNGFSGIEFWAGIPGLVGGGVAMNAGAYDIECSDITEFVEYVLPDGAKRIDSKKLKWKYRRLELPEYSVITSTVFRLNISTSSAVKEKVDEYIKDRENKHPLDFPSCGSVFKNPDDCNKGAWQLIKEAGLSGYSVGGAKVSEKHTNFIINTGGAKTSDILDLIQEIKKRVKSKSGIELEEELRVL